MTEKFDFTEKNFDWIVFGTDLTESILVASL